MKKILKSKKAVSAKVFYWIFVLIIVIPMMLFSIFQVINTFTSQITKTNNLENLLIEDRILKILSFTDPNTGRSYPGIIYLPHFNEEFINNSLKTKRQFGLKLNIDEKNPVYFNEDFYEIAYPLKDTNKYQETLLQRYVLLRGNDGSITPSYMKISITHYREDE